jgi:hypothetical protein
VDSLEFDKIAGRVAVVLRTATHSLAVTACRRNFEAGSTQSKSSGSSGHEYAQDVVGPLLATLWGPTRSVFVQFIDEILDAEVSVELRKVSDGALVYAASGDNGGLELML